MTNKRGGGGTATKGKRNNIQENDVFFSKPVAKTFLEYLKPHFDHYIHPKIFDSCANNGILGKTIQDIFDEQDNHAMVSTHDIKDNKISAETYHPGQFYDIIIANPPWVPVTLAEKIYHRLNSFLTASGVLIFIINSTFVYQGWKRAVELNYHKWYFFPRYVFKACDRPLLDCGVMIYHKNNDVPHRAVLLKPYIHIPKELAIIKEF